LVQPPEQMHKADFEAKHGLKRAKPNRQGHFEGSWNVNPRARDQEGSHATREPGSTTSKSLGAADAGERNESLQNPLSEQINDAQLNVNKASHPKKASLGGQGQARDPMDEEPPWLGIGAGEDENQRSPDIEIVAESPTAAEFNIYDTAYQNVVERIRRAQGQDAKVYLTRRVDTKAEHKADEKRGRSFNCE